LATLARGGPDGTLAVVNPPGTRFVEASAVAPTLQAALDSWSSAEPALRQLASAFADDDVPGAEPLHDVRLAAPLPRAYAFLDGSAYPHHMSVIRQARGAAMPADFFEAPLLYQGLSDPFLGPNEDIVLPEDDRWGVDLEAEVALITTAVPLGVSKHETPSHVALVTLLNDVSLRLLIPPELARGFGFVQGKSASSMGPFAVTPDELGSAWDGHRLNGRYLVHVRGELLGELDPGRDMAFDYGDLIVHATKSRALGAGTVIGAGALANENGRTGSGCLAEARAREQIRDGVATTAYLRSGDTVRLEVLRPDGTSVFGAIDQALRVSRRGS